MAAVTFGVNEETLTDEDKPSYVIHSEDNLLLKPNEGFAFGADVHPGYFQVKFENVSGKAKKFGQGPSGTLRIKISWPNQPWSKVIVEDAVIGSMTHKAYCQTFCIHTAARLDILLRHNGQSQPLGFRNSHFDVGIHSCNTKESCLVTNAGLQPAAVVEQWWERKAEVIMWRALEPEALNGRQGFAAVGVGHEVLVFGGEENDKLLNQLLVLDCRKDKLLQFGDVFHRKETENTAVFTGVCPAPRAGHSAVVWCGKVLYFGGFVNPDFTPTAEIASFYIHDRIWAVSEHNATGISRAAASTMARGFHTAVAWEEAMYVFGGCTDLAAAKAQAPQGFATTPLWKYTVAERRWLQLHTSNVPYGGRVYGHGAVCVGGVMYVFGGMTEKGLSGDLWALDLARNAWTFVQTTGRAPVRRAFPCFWALEPAAGETEEPHLWPVPRLRPERVKEGEAQANQLQALCVFGGHGGGKPTTEDICVLALKPFRGHVEFEWFTKAVAEPQLRLSPTPDDRPATSGAGEPSQRPKFLGAMEEKFNRAGRQLRGGAKEANYSTNPLIGSHALVLGHGNQLNLVLLGLGPPTANPPAELPELTVLEGIQPFDYKALFTTCKGKPVYTEEDNIVMAFAEFERTVEMLQAQLTVVHRIQQQEGLGAQFAEACEELRTLVKRGNKLCLKFPADGFGAKGADLLQLFEVLQQKWTLLMETIPPAPEPEEEEDEEAPDTPDHAGPGEEEGPFHAGAGGHGDAAKRATRMKRIGNTFKGVGKKTLALPKTMRHTAASSSAMPASPLDRTAVLSSPPPDSFTPPRPAGSPPPAPPPPPGPGAPAPHHKPSGPLHLAGLGGIKMPRFPFGDAAVGKSPRQTPAEKGREPSAAEVARPPSGATPRLDPTAAVPSPPAKAPAEASNESSASSSTTPDPSPLRSHTPVDAGPPAPPTAPAAPPFPRPLLAPHPHAGPASSSPPLTPTAAAWEPAQPALQPVRGSSDHDLPAESSEVHSQSSGIASKATTPSVPAPRRQWTHSPLSISSSGSEAGPRLFPADAGGDGNGDGDAAAFAATLAAIEAQLKCLRGSRGQSLTFRQNACSVLHHLLEQAQWLRPVGLPDDQRLTELSQQAEEVFAHSGGLEWESGARTATTTVSVLVEEAEDTRSDSHVSESERSDSLRLATPQPKPGAETPPLLPAPPPAEAGPAEAGLTREFETQLSLLQESILVVKRLKGPADSHQPHAKGLKSLNPAGLLRTLGTKRKELEASRQELRHRVNKCSQLSKAMPVTPQNRELLAKFGTMLSEAQSIYAAQP